MPSRTNIAHAVTNPVHSSAKPKQHDMISVQHYASWSTEDAPKFKKLPPNAPSRSSRTIFSSKKHCGASSSHSSSNTGWLPSFNAFSAFFNGLKAKMRNTHLPLSRSEVSLYNSPKKTMSLDRSNRLGMDRSHCLDRALFSSQHVITADGDETKQARIKKVHSMCKARSLSNLMYDSNYEIPASLTNASSVHELSSMSNDYTCKFKSARMPMIDQIEHANSSRLSLIGCDGSRQQASLSKVECMADSYYCSSIQGNYYGTPRPPREPLSTTPGTTLSTALSATSHNTPSDVILPGKSPSSKGKRQRNRSSVEAIKSQQLPAPSSDSPEMSAARNDRGSPDMLLDEEMGKLPSNWEKAYTENGEPYFIE